MKIDLNYNDIDFKEKIINLPKEVKEVNIYGDNIDIHLFCDILEDVKENVIINSKYYDEIKREFKKRKTFQGFNRSILNMVKKICNENITKNDYVVDMTIGNGNDTLFLANLSKKVFGFDIQDTAIKNTKELLIKNNVLNYDLFNTSHDKINDVLKEYKNNIKLILFNLGYLPCGNKNITTNHKTTLDAVKNSFSMLSNDGLILIVFYPHPEGKLEAEYVIKYLNENNKSFKIYKNTSNEDAPYLVVINSYDKLYM